MKKQLFSNLVFKKTASISLMLIGFSLSCTKSEDVKPTTAEIKTSTSTSLDVLVKFLSKTLNVETHEVVYDEKTDQFTIRGNKFNRKDIESTYRNANVYQTNNND
jgi:hypothetical protein